MIRHGVVADYADLARLGHVTRARVYLRSHPFPVKIYGAYRQIIDVS